SPNGKLHRLLTRLAFENLCHPFQPFIIGQKMTAPRFSALYNVPLVVYGENPIEYGDSSTVEERPTMNPSFFMAGFYPQKLVLGGLTFSQLRDQYGVDRRDLNPYLPVDPKRLKALGTEVHYMSYYFSWDPQSNFYYSAENTKYEVNPERVEGTYCKYSSI